jgi:hypothetical protein
VSRVCMILCLHIGPGLQRPRLRVGGQGRRDSPAGGGRLRGPPGPRRRGDCRVIFQVVICGPGAAAGLRPRRAGRRHAMRLRPTRHWTGLWQGEDFSALHYKSSPFPLALLQCIVQRWSCIVQRWSCIVQRWSNLNRCRNNENMTQAPGVHH